MSVPATRSWPGPAVERLVTRLSDWVVAHPVRTLLLALVVLLGGMSGLPKLHFDADSRVFFGEDNPQRLALDRLEETFGRFNSVVFVVTAKGGDLFTTDGLSAIDDLTTRAWQLPYSTRVDSLATYHRTHAAGDEILVEPLFEDPALLDAEGLAEVRRLALGEEQLRGRLVSDDGRVTAVAVGVQPPRKSRAEIGEIAAFARALQAEIQQAHPAIEVRLTGGVMADVTFVEAGRLDMSELVPIMALLIVAALLVGLKSITATLVTVLVVAASCLFALGIAAHLGITLNSATGGSPVIIMTLCIADCVHVMTTMAINQRAGMSRRDALAKALRFNAVAIFMTSFTDVLGFMALNFGDSPPLQELGNIVSIGVVAGFFFSVTLAPALLMLMPKGWKGLIHLRGERSVARISRALVDRRRGLFTGYLLVAFGMGLGLTQIVYDDDFIKYFDESFEFRRDTEYLQDNLTGLQVLQFVLPAGEQDGVARPDYMQQVDAFAEWLRAQPQVVHVTAVSDIVKTLNRNLHGDDPAFEVVPAERDLIAQLLLFYELSVPYGQDLTTQIDIAKSTTKLTAQLVHVSAADIRRIGAEAEAWLRANAPAMASPATGLSMAYAYLSKVNVDAMINGTFVALTLISLTMLLVLRDWRLALLSLLPNLVPAIQSLGIWGWTAGEVNLAVSVVASISFGIIVDDTTHLLAKFAQARARGLDRRAATEETLSEVGFAVILTSFVLISGFIILSISGFAVSHQMGLLTAITVGIAVFAEFCMMPALLMWSRKERR
jgi:predicted RND superfamily exporter protein